MRPFSLLVKPAGADCNLRCAYCFYLKRAGLYPGVTTPRMGDAVLERMIQSYLATPQPQYAFGWQGGEPMLMGLDFFRRVTDLQQRHAPAGAMIANGLQTNGTVISDEWADHLARYRFLVGVSLDGPAAVHDRFRKTRTGQGTHADVLRGISILRRHGVEFNILTLVTKANARQPREIYRYLRDHGFLYQQYIECVEFDAHGRLQPWAVGAEEWGDFLCALYDEWIATDTRVVSIRLFDAILAVLVGASPPMCSLGTDCTQYFVVEHNGDVYPCDFYVREDLRLGNVLTHSWESLASSGTYQVFGNCKSRLPEACRTCAWVRFCAGDCLKNRGWEPGGGARLSALCEGWKRFYRHALPGFERLAALVKTQREGMVMPQPLSRERPPKARPGRNDPCPCGSGRKFKKCCGSLMGVTRGEPATSRSQSDRTS